MIRKMNLRMQLFTLISLVIVITFIIVSYIVSYRSIEMAKDDAFLLADEMSARYSYEIKSDLQAARVTSESLKTVFETLIERGQADRDTLNEILKNSLKQKKYIISFCVAFEPNKLDGKDAQYAGQYPLYDESGRYAPYWSLQDGEIGVEPLAGFDGDEWYAGARDSKKEYITDPFFYEVQGTSVLMTSLVFPIMIDGEFIGIVSSDMALDSLQDMVSHVNTSGLDEFTEIYSNSGLVVAHPEDQYFNKSVYAQSAYTMLTSDPSKAQKALEVASAYLKGNPVTNKEDVNQVKEYADSAAFVDNLTAYVKDTENVNLDLTLLTNDMAKELLQLDMDRVVIAERARQAIVKGESFTVTQDNYYKIYMPIRFSEATKPWSVAVNVPIPEVLKKSNDIKNYVMLVSAVSLVLIAIVLYFVTRNLTQPILNLADFAKQVGEGNFSIDIPKATNSDEIGVLSRAFRTMMEKINDLISKLTKNSEELEKKNEYLNELNMMLVEAKDHAEASDRAKSIFLSNMSHEMRTPLNAIVGMTAIGQRAKEDGKRDYSFKKIEEASAHLLSLVNDILDMSKMETDKLELSSVKFNFSKMLGDAIDAVSIRLKEKNQVLRIDIDDDIPETVVGDAFRLSQMIRNLLSNAVKFTGEQGEIGVKAFVKDSDNELYTLQVEVSDTGIGISEEQQSRLFRLFEQADNSASRSFGGTGLGLALSKRIAGIMGGEIWVESELDKGSTFFFTVTLKRSVDNLESNNAISAPDDTNATAQEDDGFAAGTAEEEHHNEYNGKKILLVEDVDTNREIVLAMLETTGVETDCALNGKEAYEMFAANPERYDLILMDIQMPVMDGIEATKLIRLLDKDVPIVALTANVFKDDVKKYIESGINSHIGKPLNYVLMMGMLEKYLK